MSEFEVTKENRVRQVQRKAAYDHETVHAILDAGHVAQVAFVDDSQPLVIPMLYGRQHDALYLHGARKARLIKLLEKSPRVCINVTLLDGVVIARSIVPLLDAVPLGQCVRGADAGRRARPEAGRHARHRRAPGTGALGRGASLARSRGQDDRGTARAHRQRVRKDFVRPAAR